jgi:dTDP-4-dehydrorhamnose reductase
MRAIVVGIDGAIGRALTTALQQRRITVYGTTRHAGAMTAGLTVLDLADPASAHIALPDAEVAFFCAAMARFDDCRRHPDLAHMVNSTVPVALARRLAAAGLRVILLSTSAVFDWRLPHSLGSRPPCPLTAYGRTKAEAEAGFLSLGDAAAVVRFAKVLAPESTLFNGWIDALREGRQIRAFTDSRMAPVPLTDAVAALLAVAEAGQGGIYQLSSTHDIDYFEAARHLARRLGRGTRLVSEASARESGISPEEITAFSSLDSSRLAALTGRPPPDPFAAIDQTFGRVLALSSTNAEPHERLPSRA